jgi:hypothetical protein
MNTNTKNKGLKMFFVGVSALFVMGIAFVARGEVSAAKCPKNSVCNAAPKIVFSGSNCDTKTASFCNWAMDVYSPEPEDGVMSFPFYASTHALQNTKAIDAEDGDITNNMTATVAHVYDTPANIVAMINKTLGSKKTKYTDCRDYYITYTVSVTDSAGNTANKVQTEYFCKI